MDLEDFAQPEVAVAAVVAAAVFSPKARSWIRKGIVYATAGVLIAGDAVGSMARSVGQGVQQAAESTGNTNQATENQAKATVAASPAARKAPAKTSVEHPTASKTGTEE